ncbi:Holliday junction resolvase RuvX [Patescibacteria group bacterium]|nr:Holliday junction resolvase RuvX [Patescibacteria group bacterium]
MKILALDFGEKRIGLAAGDSKIGVAAARNFLANNSEIFKTLAELVKRDGVERILVGLPRGFHSETRETKDARKFARRLQAKTAAKVELADERFTSRIAEANLRAAGEDSRQQKNLIDSEAARIILQEYFDSNF